MLKIELIYILVGDFLLKLLLMWVGLFLSKVLIWYYINEIRLWRIMWVW